MNTIFPRVVDLITTSSDKKFEPIARMADAIIDLTLQQGFAKQETDEQWHMAYAMAMVEIRLIAGQQDLNKATGANAVRYSDTKKSGRPYLMNDRGSYADAYQVGDTALLNSQRA